MTTLATPTAELVDRGNRALLRELGPAGFIQYIQHFEKGSGDYTADRHRWLTESVDDIFNAIEPKAVPPDNAQ